MFQPVSAGTAPWPLVSQEPFLTFMPGLCGPWQGVGMLYCDREGQTQKLCPLRLTLLSTLEWKTSLRLCMRTLTCEFVVGRGCSGVPSQSGMEETGGYAEP